MVSVNNLYYEIMKDKYNNGRPDNIKHVDSVSFWGFRVSFSGELVMRMPVKNLAKLHV